MDMAEKDDTEGRCPACRTVYDKEKIVGMASSCERSIFLEFVFLSAFINFGLLTNPSALGDSLPIFFPLLYCP